LAKTDQHYRLGDADRRRRSRLRWRGVHRTVRGYKLANDDHDTRAIQHYLRHRNIQHTVRYTEMAPDQFKAFWKD